MKCLRTSVTKEKTLVEKGENKFQEVSTYYLWASSSELSVSEVMHFVPVVAHLSLLASLIYLTPQLWPAVQQMSFLGQKET